MCKHHEQIKKTLYDGVKMCLKKVNNQITLKKHMLCTMERKEINKTKINLTNIKKRIGILWKY